MPLLVAQFVVVAFVITMIGVGMVTALILYTPSGAHVASLDVTGILAPPGAMLNDMLAARASPNQRLRSAFGLRNTFVVDDAVLHSSFVQNARRIIQASTFQAVRDETVEAALGYFASGSPLASYDFGVAIQVITLRTVLVALLGADPSAMDQDDLVVVAAGIIELWELSKSASDAAGRREHLRFTISTLLSEWVPDLRGFNSVLDILIPVWETMWRVVAVAAAYGERDVEAVQAFAELFEDPSNRDRFAGTKNGPCGVTPEMFILETLRLNPPTRRIARAVSTPHPFVTLLPSWLSAALLPRCWLSPTWFAPTTVVHKADVEAAQRDPRVWGDDACVFDAKRFANAGTRPPLFAFGAGRLACVAQTWAPRAAAVIVASIYHVLDEEALVLVRGKEIGGRGGWEGWHLSKREPGK
jgi:hypothetical protein